MSDWKKSAAKRRDEHESYATYAVVTSQEQARVLSWQEGRVASAQVHGLQRGEGARAYLVGGLEAVGVRGLWQGVGFLPAEHVG
jgi:hypothetical protein